MTVCERETVKKVDPASRCSPQKAHFDAQLKLEDGFETIQATLQSWTGVTFQFNSQIRGAKGTDHKKSQL